MELALPLQSCTSCLLLYLAPDFGLNEDAHAYRVWSKRCGFRLVHKGLGSISWVRIRLVWHRCCIHLLDRVGDLLSF